MTSFLLRLTMFSMVMQSLAQVQTVDCEADPENMYCCPLQQGAPCLLEGFVNTNSPCSAACQKRYESLGYDCYKDYQLHFKWENMKRNCDPSNIVEFKPPETSFRPDYGPWGGVTAAGATKTTASITVAGIVVFALAGIAY
eukprot:symbB.v1.2.001243.t1/scaffold63.1/size477159/14